MTAALIAQLEEEFGVENYVNSEGHGVQLLPEQLTESNNYNKLLIIYLDQLQELHGVNSKMYAERSIYTATGINLDNWGFYLNEPRNGNTDEVYRIRLFARSGELSSFGSITNLKATFQGLLDPITHLLFEKFPCSNLIQGEFLTYQDLTDFLPLIKRASGGGIDILLSSHLPNSFRFSENVGESGTGGFKELYEDYQDGFRFSENVGESGTGGFAETTGVTGFFVGVVGLSYVGSYIPGSPFAELFVNY